MAKPDPILEKALIAALQKAGDSSWRELTLAAITEAAGLSLDDLFGLATKEELALAASAHFDRAMSCEGAALKGDARERLFDVIMLRFEAMEPFRAGLISLFRHRDGSPRALAQVPAERLASARWALACAGLDNDEGAPLAAKSLAVAYVIDTAERAWRTETSADYARTMSALDKALRDSEARMKWLTRFGRRGEGTQTAKDTQAT
jgi:hypothetical protein